MGNLYNVDATTGNIVTAGSITAAGGIISTSTTTGFLPPRLTTAQRNLIVVPTLTTGLQIFNTDTVQDEFYNGTMWVAVGAGTGVPGGSSGQVQYNNSGVFGGLTIGTSITPIFNNAGVLDVSIATPLQIVSGTLSIIIDNSTLDSAGPGNALEIKAGGITNTQISATAAIAASKLSAAGSSSQIQFNNSGTFQGDSDLTWNASLARLTIVGAAVSATPEIILGSTSQSGQIQLPGRGNIAFGDASTHFIFLTAPTSVTQYSLVLPTAQGTASTFLQNDGSGNLSWVAGGSGNVTTGTGGNMTLYPNTGTSVSDTYVQNTHNIIMSIQAQPVRTINLNYIIPNPGNSVTSANLVLDQGNYTIAGSWIFSTNLTINGTISTDGNAISSDGSGNLTANGLIASGGFVNIPTLGNSTIYLGCAGDVGAEIRCIGVAGEITYDLFDPNFGAGTSFFQYGAVYHNTRVGTPLTVGDLGQPDNSAVLDIRSTTRGVIMPRMTTTQRNAISSPLTGLEIFNTTTTQLEFYNGTAWVAVGSSFTNSITTVTTTFTASSANIILADATGGTFTVTLPPAASSTNLEYTLKKIDSSANAVTFKGNASENIDGSNMQVLNSQYQSITVVCDGTSWWVI